jgi:elongator complex protein 1
MRPIMTEGELMTAYTLSGKPQKALKAYERAHAWRELFALALKEEVSKDSIAEMVERVAGELEKNGVLTVRS